MVTGDLLNVGPRDTQVVQLTSVESGKLTNGLLISGLLLDRLTNTHFISPSGSCRNLPARYKWIDSLMDGV